jgi:hypothetical protein
MKKLIIYCTGGLTNRVFPIASGINLARITGRELYVYWPLDNRCLANFNDLYDYDLKFVGETFLSGLDVSNSEFHSEYQASVQNDYTMYNRTFLHDKMLGGKLHINNLNIINNESENILLVTNNFIKCVTENENRKSLVEMTFKKELLELSNKYIIENGIDKNTIGAHIRGTDLKQHNPLGAYLNQIESRLSSDINQIIFVSSDDSEIESTVKDRFGDRVICRMRKKYVEKKNKNNSWLNNTNTTVEMMKDSIIDLIILSKTNFIIQSNGSTFTSYADILSKQ